MLTQLRIKNFALVEDLELDVSGKFIALTGETGAGKSILIDAIRFVLGERLDQIRFQSPAAGISSTVEAVFDLEVKSLAVDPVFESVISPDDELLILKREVLADGKSKAWINGHPVNLSLVKSLGASLLDIHGQYDHQLLFEPASQLELIDRFASIDSLKTKYQKIFHDYHTLLLRQNELERLEQGRERELDLLKYQISEIEKAELEEGEEENLRLEKSRLANAEKLFEITSRILEKLDQSEPSVSSLAGESSREMAQLSRLDPTTQPLSQDFENAQLALEEVIRQVRDYQESLSFDSDRLGEIEARLDLIHLLEKKYGSSVGEVLKFLEVSRARYDQLSNAALYEKETRDKIKALVPELTRVADEMTAQRKKAAAGLQTKIVQELKDLQILHGKFECQIEKCDFSYSGQDSLEFMICINPGQPLAPLRKIVSAGETSRVMLALKKTLAKVDSVPTLIFDEIDANIGGRLGTVTGQKLQEISKERQVLLITHLPQIASFADKHIKVSKVVTKGKTQTVYKTITGDERVKELAQMMSGQEMTEISKKHAAEMLLKVVSRPSTSSGWRAKSNHGV